MVLSFNVKIDDGIDFKILKHGQDNTHPFQDILLNVYGVY